MEKGSSMAPGSMERAQGDATQLAALFFRAKAAAHISPMGVRAAMAAGSIRLVDVRLPGPQVSWRIPGSLIIPAPEVGRRCAELPKDRPVVLYCWDSWCSLATQAALVLVEQGYRVQELYGGVAAWQAMGLPQASVDPHIACQC
jgi:rhodanese-related sulfurtransferase